MLDKEMFVETIRSLEEVAKASDTPLSKAEIAAYLKDLGLSEKQQEMVYEYLMQKQKEGTQELEEMLGDAEVQEALPESQQAEAELPESAFFQMYLKDLQGIHPCTEEEENRLYQQLAEGSAETVKVLSDQWQARVLKLARRKAPSAEELPDLIQEGNMAVFLALDSLCGSGELADWQAILSEAAETAMDAYLSDTETAKDMEQSILAKAALVQKAQEFLAQEFGRIPTMAELSQYTRLPQEELEDILAMSKKKV